MDTDLLGPVVVGYDGSATSERAVDRAARVALALDAPLHVAMVVTDTISATRHDGTVLLAIDAAEELLNRARNDLDSRFGALAVESFALPSVDAGSALGKHATRVDAQLLVVGNLRERGLRRLLGSVPDDVAAQAPCDVLIVKTT